MDAVDARCGGTTRVTACLLLLLGACRDRTPAGATTLGLTKDGGVGANVRAHEERLTRWERSDRRVAIADGDVLDDSAPCAPTSAAPELRVHERKNALRRVSLKNCLGQPLAVYFQSAIAPLDVDAFDARGARVERTSTHATAKFDNTAYCSYLRTLAPGQEQLLEDVSVVDTPEAAQIRSGAFEIRGPVVRLELSLSSLRRECVDDTTGAQRPLPAGTWQGRVVGPAITLVAKGPP